jgi:sec-independent protein translocase protein TatC
LNIEGSNPSSSEKKTGYKMTASLFLHFFEIKIRCLYLLFSFFLTFLLISFCFEDIFFLWVKPLLNDKFSNIKPHEFIFTEVTEAFETVLFFSIGISSLLLLPLIIYNIWAFIIPSCYTIERRTITKNCVFFIVFFSFSSCINYLFIIPHIWWFFLNFETNGTLFSIQYETRILSSIQFIFRTMWWITIIGQLPLIIYWAIILQWIKWEEIKNKKHYFWIVSILFAALISPPEIWTQTISIGIFLNIIELGFFITALTHSYHYKKSIKYV